MSTTDKSKAFLAKFKRKVLRCDTCGDDGVIAVDHVEGNQLCVNCGRVVENVLISDQQEWRNFNTETLGSSRGEKSRVGEYNDAWLDTTTTTTFIGGSKKMQQLQNRVGNFESSDKILKNSFSLLRTISDALAIKEQAIERSKEMLKELNDAGLLKGRCNQLNILAVIYLGCREAGISRSLKEICIYDRNISQGDLGHAINRIKKQLPNRGNAPIEDASQLIPRLCSKLHLSNNIASLCEYAANRAALLLKSSRRTTSLAAGIIFFVTQLTIGQNSSVSITDIATVCGASVNTIRITYKELQEIAHKILPPKFNTSKQK